MTAFFKIVNRVIVWAQLLNLHTNIHVVIDANLQFDILLEILETISEQPFIVYLKLGVRLVLILTLICLQAILQFLNNFNVFHMCKAKYSQLEYTYRTKVLDQLLPFFIVYLCIRLHQLMDNIRLLLLEYELGAVRTDPARLPILLHFALEVYLVDQQPILYIHIKLALRGTQAHNRVIVL